MSRRVTIELDEDVAARLEEEARRRGASVDAIVSATLSRLAPSEPSPREPYKVERVLHLRDGLTINDVWKALVEDDDHRWLK